ncbi:MAG: hypothetical protein HN720_00530, partial [Nitrospinaceae bacterium]|nr:hypothetical protein [Nitrospinaceae bacterium]
MAEERTADLIELARAVSGARVEGAENVQVCGMEFDSRRAMAGNLFVAVPGFEVDGHEYARAAVDAGAAALVLEREVDGIPADFPRIIVPSSREAMALIADAFYEHPSGE